MLILACTAASWSAKRRATCPLRSYINLYKSELPEDLTTKDALLSNVELPKLDQEEQENLDLPFTSKVIEKALISLQSNKSPEEDGFPPSRIL